ncbi:MAG: hypothetical protein ABSE81_04615 [Candidatus Omnitrophota bacterium]|jgi:hypothetical protein
MVERNRSIYLEHISTFLLLLASAGLLGGVLSRFGLYACLGLLCGFIFSWYNPQVTDNLWVKTAGKVAALVTVIWTFYAVFNSTFGYQEVVLIYIKGALILEVLLSFNLASPGNLNYMQVLSVPIFMTFPVFTSAINPGHIALLAVYLAVWMVLLRVKFCLAYAPLEEINLLERQHFLPFIFFLFAVALAWALYYYILLPVHKEGGILRQQGVSLTLPALEKEYYGLRDKVQEEATKMTFNLPTKEQRQESLFDLESLINEKALTIVVSNAEEGLISYAKQSGAGLKKGEDLNLAVMLKKFVDKKIEFNLKKADARMMEILRENPLNIGVRIWAVTEAAKLQRADTLDKLREYKQDIQATIMNTPLGESAKKEEKQLIQKVQDWKVFQMYRAKIQELKSQLDSSSSALQDELNKAYDSLKEARTSEQLEKLEAENSKIEASKDPQEKAFADNLKEAVDLKRMMLMKAESSEIDSAVEDAYLPEYRSNELKEQLNTLQYSEDADEVVDTHQSLEGAFEQEGVNASSRLGSLSDMKSSVMLRSAGNDLNEALNKNVPPGLSNQMKNDLFYALRERNSGARSAAFDKVHDEVKQFGDNGFIASPVEEKMQKSVEDIKRLTEFKAELKTKDKKTVVKKAQNKTAGAVNKTVRLLRLRIMPLSVVIPSGRDAAIRAIGYYDDNSQKEITNEVRWKISDEERGKFIGGKVYGLKPGKASFFAQHGAIVSQSASLFVTDPVLTAIVAKPSSSFIGLDDKLTLKAEGYLSDNSRRDMTKIVSWHMQGSRIFKQEKGYFKPLAFGREYIWAEYAGMKSLPVEVRVGVTLAWVLKIAGIVFLILCLLVILILGILYSLSRMRAGLIAGLAATDKRAFVIALYNNNVEVFKIFGLGNRGNLPPLAYAVYTALLLGAEKDIFEQFAVKYEKAQYSRHDITDEDAATAHSIYRDIMNIMLQQRKGARYILGHCFRLLKRLPIRI